MGHFRRCPIATATTDAVDAKERLEQARQFAIEVARLAADTKCQNVIVLDVSGLSPVTDFMVIATGTSARQMRAVVDDSEEMALGREWKPYTRSGLEGESWMVLDFVDVVLHLFNPESRMYYDLESLWGDAPRVNWKR